MEEEKRENPMQNEIEDGAADPAAPCAAFTASTPEEECVEPESDAPSSAVGEDAADAEESTPEADPSEAGEDGKELSPEAEVPATPVWDFGSGASPDACAAKKERDKDGTKRFYRVFAIVAALCFVALVVTFFLGNTGFKIVRTVEKERTVFVHDHDESGTLLSAQEAAARVQSVTVAISVNTAEFTGVASGIIYTEDGYILTNHHVVENGGPFQVMLPNGDVLDAALIGSNEAADVAVLKINAAGLTPAIFGDSDNLLAGDAVLAVGTPANLDYAGAVAFGRISAPLHIMKITDTNGTVVRKMKLIQTDAGVNNGNSGGPLADYYGHVIGMINMRLSTYAGNTFIGINFALPINGVKTVADAIIAHGSFDGAKNPIAENASMIGFSGYAVSAGKWYLLDPESGKVESSDSEQSGYRHAARDGVMVGSVLDTGGAAGILLEGDLILRINGLTMLRIQDVIAEANRHWSGESVRILLLRGGAELEAEIVIGEKSA